MSALSAGMSRPGEMILFLAIAFLAICCSRAAPVSEHDTTHIAEYETESGCYYNFQRYQEGDRIVTNEPCLNCTCHNRMLMCYLRVCPFTKAIGQNCTVEKRPDQCCPIITCPEVPVQLLTSTPNSPAIIGSTEIGAHDNYGCRVEEKFYADGAQLPVDPRNPCELCYCIRNRTTCVMQECTLRVAGCNPVYLPGVCCPVKYNCDYDEEQTTTLSPTTPGLIMTTTVAPGQSTPMCYRDGNAYNDGELIDSGRACQHCYCFRGDIVCAVQDCKIPMKIHGKHCTPQPAPEGKCCPTTYQCDGESSPTEVEEEPQLSGELPIPDHPYKEQATESPIPGLGYLDEDNNQPQQMVDVFPGADNTIPEKSGENKSGTEGPIQQETVKPFEETPIELPEGVKTENPTGTSVVEPEHTPIKSTEDVNPTEVVLPEQPVTTADEEKDAPHDSIEHDNTVQTTATADETQTEVNIDEGKPISSVESTDRTVSEDAIKTTEDLPTHGIVSEDEIKAIDELPTEETVPESPTPTEVTSNMHESNEGSEEEQVLKEPTQSGIEQEGPEEVTTEEQNSSKVPVISEPQEPVNPLPGNDEIAVEKSTALPTQAVKSDEEVTKEPAVLVTELTPIEGTKTEDSNIAISPGEVELTKPETSEEPIFPETSTLKTVELEAPEQPIKETATTLTSIEESNVFPESHQNEPEETPVSATVLPTIVSVIKDQSTEKSGSTEGHTIDDISMAKEPTQHESNTAGAVPATEVPTDEVPTSEIQTGEIPISKLPTGEVPTSEVPTNEVPSPDEVTSEVLSKGEGSKPQTEETLIDEEHPIEPTVTEEKQPEGPIAVENPSQPAAHDQEDSIDIPEQGPTGIPISDRVPVVKADDESVVHELHVTEVYDEVQHTHVPDSLIIDKQDGIPATYIPPIGGTAESEITPGQEPVTTGVVQEIVPHEEQAPQIFKETVTPPSSEKEHKPTPQEELEHEKSTVIGQLPTEATHTEILPVELGTHEDENGDKQIFNEPTENKVNASESPEVSTDVQGVELEGFPDAKPTEPQETADNKQHHVPAEDEIAKGEQQTEKPVLNGELPTDNVAEEKPLEVPTHDEETPEVSLPEENLTGPSGDEQKPVTGSAMEEKPIKSSENESEPTEVSTAEKEQSNTPVTAEEPLTPSITEERPTEPGVADEKQTETTIPQEQQTVGPISNENPVEAGVTAEDKPSEVSISQEQETEAPINAEVPSEVNSDTQEKTDDTRITEDKPTEDSSIQEELPTVSIIDQKPTEESAVEQELTEAPASERVPTQAPFDVENPVKPSSTEEKLVDTPATDETPMKTSIVDDESNVTSISNEKPTETSITGEISTQTSVAEEEPLDVGQKPNEASITENTVTDIPKSEQEPPLVTDENPTESSFVEQQITGVSTSAGESDVTIVEETSVPVTEELTESPVTEQKIFKTSATQATPTESTVQEEKITNVPAGSEIPTEESAIETKTPVAVVGEEKVTAISNEEGQDTVASVTAENLTGIPEVEQSVTDSSIIEEKPTEAPIAEHETTSGSIEEGVPSGTPIAEVESEADSGTAVSQTELTTPKAVETTSADNEPVNPLVSMEGPVDTSTIDQKTIESSTPTNKEDETIIPEEGPTKSSDSKNHLSESPADTEQDALAGENKPTDATNVEEEQTNISVSEEAVTDKNIIEVEPTGATANEQKPTGTVFMEEKPTEISVTDEKITDLPVTETKPSDASIAGEQPTNTPVSNIKETEPAEEGPTTASKSEENLPKPSVIAENSTPASVGEEKLIEPSIAAENPAENTVAEGEVTESSTAEERPTINSIIEENLTESSIVKERPVESTDIAGEPTAPSIPEKEPTKISIADEKSTISSVSENKLPQIPPIVENVPQSSVPEDQSTEVSTSDDELVQVPLSEVKPTEIAKPEEGPIEASASEKTPTAHSDTPMGKGEITGVPESQENPTEPSDNRIVTEESTKPSIVEEKPVNPITSEESPSGEPPSDEKPTVTSIIPEEPTKMVEKEKLPIEPSVGEQQPIEPSVEEQQPIEPSVGEQQPIEPSVEKQQPIEPSVGEQQPIEPSVEEQQPIEPSVEKQQPIEPSVEKQQPIEPSVGEQQPIEPSVEDKQPIEPSAGEQQPIEPSVEEQQPIEPSVGEKQPIEPSVEEQQPIEPSVGEKQPIEPSVGEKQPIEPSVEEQQPIEPSVGEKQPIEPSVVEQQPIEPSVVEQQPIEPSVGEKRPIEPSVEEQQPIEPSVGEKQLIEPSVEEQQPTEPFVGEKQLIEPSVEEQQPIEPPVGEKQPIEPSVEEQQPIEPSVGEKQPIEPSVGEERPIEPPVEERQPIEPSVGEKQPIEPSVEEQQPIEPSVGEKQTIEPSVKEQQPIEPSVEEQQPIEPSVEEQQPIEPSVEEQQPIEPSVEQQQPIEPSVEEQQPIEPSVGEKHPIEPSVGEQQPIEPSVEEKQPIEPSVGEQQPIEPSVGEQQPIEPSVGEKQPIEPTIAEQQPIEPSVEEQQPIEPSIGEQQPIKPSVEEQTAITATPEQQQPSEPSKQVPSEIPSKMEKEDQTTIEQERPEVFGDNFPSSIPGEGNCLVDGQSFANNSRIPPANLCQTRCLCISSIVHCDLVECSPPPSQLSNCMPIHTNTDSCCPIYSCDSTPTVDLKSDSQMAENHTPGYEGVHVPSTDDYSKESSTPIIKYPAEPSDEVTPGSEEQSSVSVHEDTTPSIESVADLDQKIVEPIEQEIPEPNVPVQELSGVSETNEIPEQPIIDQTEQNPKPEVVDQQTEEAIMPTEEQKPIGEEKQKPESPSEVPVEAVTTNNEPDIIPVTTVGETTADQQSEGTPTSDKDTPLVSLVPVSEQSPEVIPTSETHPVETGTSSEEQTTDITKQHRPAVEIETATDQSAVPAGEDAGPEEHHAASEKPIDNDTVVPVGVLQEGEQVVDVTQPTEKEPTAPVVPVDTSTSVSEEHFENTEHPETSVTGANEQTPGLTESAATSPVPPTDQPIVESTDKLTTLISQHPEEHVPQPESDGQVIEPSTPTDESSPPKDQLDLQQQPENVKQEVPIDSSTIESDSEVGAPASTESSENQSVSILVPTDGINLSNNAETSTPTSTGQVEDEIEGSTVIPIKNIDVGLPILSSSTEVAEDEILPTEASKQGEAQTPVSDPQEASQEASASTTPPTVGQDLTIDSETTISTVEEHDQVIVETEPSIISSPPVTTKASEPSGNTGEQITAVDKNEAEPISHETPATPVIESAESVDTAPESQDVGEPAASTESTEGQVTEVKETGEPVDSQGAQPSEPTANTETERTGVEEPTTRPTSSEGDIKTTTSEESVIAEQGESSEPPVSVEGESISVEIPTTGLPLFKEGTKPTLPEMTGEDHKIPTLEFTTKPGSPETAETLAPTMNQEDETVAAEHSTSSPVLIENAEKPASTANVEDQTISDVEKPAKSSEATENTEGEPDVDKKPISETALPDQDVRIGEPEVRPVSTVSSVSEESEAVTIKGASAEEIPQSGAETPPSTSSSEVQTPAMEDSEFVSPDQGVTAASGASGEEETTPAQHPAVESSAPDTKSPIPAENAEEQVISVDEFESKPASPDHPEEPVPTSQPGIVSVSQEDTEELASTGGVEKDIIPTDQTASEPTLPSEGETPVPTVTEEAVSISVEGEAISIPVSDAQTKLVVTSATPNDHGVSVEATTTASAESEESSAPTTKENDELTPEIGSTARPVISEENSETPTSTQIEVKTPETISTDAETPVPNTSEDEKVITTESPQPDSSYNQEVPTAVSHDETKPQSPIAGTPEQTVTAETPTTELVATDHVKTPEFVSSEEGENGNAEVSTAGLIDQDHIETSAPTESSVDENTPVKETRPSQVSEEEAVVAGHPTEDSGLFEHAETPIPSTKPDQDTATDEQKIIEPPKSIEQSTSTSFTPEESTIYPKEGVPTTQSISEEVPTQSTMSESVKPELVPIDEQVKQEQMPVDITPIEGQPEEKPVTPELEEANKTSEPSNEPATDVSNEPATEKPSVGEESLIKSTKPAPIEGESMESNAENTAGENEKPISAGSPIPDDQKPTRNEQPEVPQKEYDTEHQVTEISAPVEFVPPVTPAEPTNEDQEHVQTPDQTQEVPEQPAVDSTEGQLTIGSQDSPVPQVHDSIDETKPAMKPGYFGRPITSTLAPQGSLAYPDQTVSGEDNSHFPVNNGTYLNPESDDTGDSDDYEEDDLDVYGPGTCRYGGKVYVSAQQIPRDDPCDFCFCFRSDIICLQQSCPPPIPGCHEEPINGFCCPRYECPVSMATSLNLTTTTTTTTTTLPPHFLSHAYKGAARRSGCQIRGQAYRVGESIPSASGPCLECTCGGDGNMKCEPRVCSPEPMLRQMIAAATAKRRR